MPEPSLSKNNKDTIEPITGENKGVHIFLEVITPKIPLLNTK